MSDRYIIVSVGTATDTAKTELFQLFERHHDFNHKWYRLVKGVFNDPVNFSKARERLDDLVRSEMEDMRNHLPSVQRECVDCGRLLDITEAIDKHTGKRVPVPRSVWCGECAQKTCPTCEGRTTITTKRKTGSGEDDWDYAEVPCPKCLGRAVVDKRGHD